MSALPQNPVERTEYYATRQPVWYDNAHTLGLKVSATAELGARIEAVKTARNAKAAATAAARTATQTYHNALKTLFAQGAGIISLIRGTAESTNDPSIYELAQISPRRPASPVAKPGTPASPQVALEQTGALTLSWKCKNPSNASGTIYEIYRSIDGGVWEGLASTGKKSHTDATIPGGSSTISYQVRAVRSTKAGNAAQFNVRLGAGTGPAVRTVAAEPMSAVRKAA